MAAAFLAVAIFERDIMKKKIIIAVAIFLIIGVGVLAALIFNNKNNSSHTKKEVVEENKLPQMSALYKNNNIGELNGYTMEMEQKSVRDVIIPAMTGKEVKMMISTRGNNVKAINYEITAISDGRLIDGGEIQSIEKKDKYIEFSFNTSAILEPRDEYFIKFIVSTDSYKAINYYARIMVVEEDFVADQIDFAKDFSEKTFNEDDARKLALYLEVDNNQANDNLGQTTIRSNYSMLVWSTIDPEKITDTSITLKDICIKDSGQAATYTMNYQIKATNGEKIEETYNVSETITVWTCAGKLYVLAYDRELNQVWEVTKQNVGNGFIDLGIQNQTEIDFVESPNQQYLAYALNGSVYVMDLLEKKITTVNHLKADTSKVLEETKAKAISVDDKGNVNYMVYGYSRHKAHTGKNGIAIFRYDREKNIANELTFIQCTTSAMMLEEQMKNLCYIGDGTLYIMLDNTVYYVNLETKEWGTLVANLEDGSFAISKDNKLLAYNTEGKVRGSSSITIVNLTNGEKNVIEAGSDEITVCGYTGRNLVYGLGDKTKNTKFFPMYKLMIVDDALKEIKTYEPNNILIREVEITDTVIHMKRYKNGKNISDDQLLDNTENILPAAKSSYYLDNVKQRELALSFTNNLNPDLELQIIKDVEVKTDVNTEVQAAFEEITEMQYYVYGYGKFQGIYKDKQQAIKMAREVYGLVTDNNGEKVWTLEENYD